MSKFAISQGRDSQIYIFAFLTSIVLSYLIGYRNHVINPDGICYILSAQMVGSASIKDVMHLCPQSQWPFYSTLIYSLVQISQLSYSASAHVINAIFTIISVVTFITIVKELGGTSKRILWLAAFIILFAHQFNVVRDNIIRDHGFWAFYLVSIYYLLKFFKQPKMSTALAWNVSLMVSTLFRIEGVIFLLGLPFISWFSISHTFKQRAKSFLTLNSPLILIIVLFALWQVSHPEQGLQKLGRVNEVINQLQNGFYILAGRYQTTKMALIQHVLPPEGASDAVPILYLVLIGWYLYNVVLTLSFGYAALIVYAWMNRAAVFTPKSSLVVWGYIIINLLMTLVFLAEHLFISKRYLIALSLTLMIWVPFAFNDLIDKWGVLRKRVFLIIMSLMVCASALSGVVEFGQSKFYIRSAGNWIADHVPENATLYVNDFQLMYYTQHFGTHIFEILPTYLNINTITDGKWKNYDYVALRLRKQEEGEILGVMRELADVTPVHEFSNKRGNRVVIYKVSNIATDKKLERGVSIG